jgi:lipopolysaccharide export system protein LptC
MVDAAVNLETDSFPRRDDRTAAFAAAARHSSRVRFLRVAIPGVAVVAVALAAVVILFDPLNRYIGDFSVSGIGIDGTKVTMEHPKLTGFRKDGRPYVVNAQKAVQDAKQPTLIELSEIDAEIGMADKSSAHILARSGLYDSTKEHMDVRDNVEVKSPQYDVKLKSASVDFKASSFISKEPVSVVAANGTTIDADRVSAIDNGAQLIFEGNVRSTIPPPAAPVEAKDEMKGATP